MASGDHEIELRFLPPGRMSAERARNLLAALEARVTRERVQLCRDLYLDTPDQLFVRGGMGLRLRIPDAGPVRLTLKSRAAPPGWTGRRREIEERLAAAPSVFPIPTPGRRIARWAAAAFPDARLAPWLELHQRRHIRTLRLAGGARAGLFLDEVRARRPGHAGIAFRMAELEFLGGDERVFRRFAKRWARRAGWRPAPGDKLDEAARRGVWTPPAVHERKVRPENEPTVAALAAAWLRFHAERLRRHEPGVRAGVDPEAVHDMRVASRRLRAALQIFRPFLPRAAASEAGGRLALVARALGRVRDLDILMERIGRLADELGGAPAARAAILRRLETRRRRALDELRRALHGPAGGTLHRALDRLIRKTRRRAATRLPAESAEEFAHRLLRRRFFKAADGIRRPPRDLPDLHALRIQLKKLRYACEFLDGLWPHARKRAAVFVKFQDGLGALQDARVTEAALAGLAPRLPAGARRLAARMRRRLRNDMTDARRKFRRRLAFLAHALVFRP